jgi:hypothetical protein
LTRKKTVQAYFGGMERLVDPFAYQADYTHDGMVDISTRADLEMVNAAKALQNKGL